MYKYRINYFLSFLPMSVSIDRFASELFAKYSIEKEVFSKDRSILLDEPFTVPLERLIIYAKELDVPLERLYKQQEV